MTCTLHACDRPATTLVQYAEWWRDEDGAHSCISDDDVCEQHLAELRERQESADFFDGTRLIDVTDICEHEDYHMSPTLRSPDAPYQYICEHCGKVGQPDGPDGVGGECVDWNAS